MTRALTQAPLFFHAQHSKPSALYGPQFGPIDAVRRFAQGAGTSMLAFAGARNVTGAGVAEGGIPVATDFTTIDGFTQAVLEGRLTGPTQLLAGAFLFLAAGKCTARLVGLFAGLALVYLFMQGHTITEVFDLSKEFASRFGAAVAAFRGASAEASV
jgi:hypothetical protein